MKETDRTNRANRIIFRLSDEEFELLKSNMEHVSMSNREDYIRRLVLYGEAKVIDFKQLEKIDYLMGTVANNVNQIAKRCNETRSIYETDIHGVIFEVKEMQDNFKKAMMLIAEAVGQAYKSRSTSVLTSGHSDRKLS